MNKSNSLQPQLLLPTEVLIQESVCVHSIKLISVVFLAIAVRFLEADLDLITQERMVIAMHVMHEITADDLKVLLRQTWKKMNTKTFHSQKGCEIFPYTMVPTRWTGVALSQCNSMYAAS